MNAPISPGNVASFVLLMATLALLSTTPAHAQSASASAGPDATQYSVDGSSVSAAAVPQAFSGNVANGAEAANEAMSGDNAPSNSTASGPTASGPTASGPTASGPTASESAPSGSAPSGSAPATGAAAELTVLPETGGAPLLGLCAGVCLLGCGLLLARLAFV